MFIKQKQINDDVTKKVEEIKTEIDNFQKNNDDIGNKINNLQKKDEAVSIEVQQLNNQVLTNKHASEASAQFNSKMASALDDLRHVEAGYFDCGPSTSWYIKGEWSFSNITHHFSRPYTARPIVFTYMGEWFAKTNKGQVRIGFWLTNVYTTHVFVQCYKYMHDGDIDIMRINWISHPSDVGSDVGL